MGTRMEPFVVDTEEEDSDIELGGDPSNFEQLQLGNVAFCERSDVAAENHHPWMLQKHTQAGLPVVLLGNCPELPEGAVLPPSKKEKRKRAAAAAFRARAHDMLPTAVNPNKPLILFELQGVLARDAHDYTLNHSVMTVRPDLELLLQLMPRYQVGVFTTTDTQVTLRLMDRVRARLAQAAASSGAASPGPPQLSPVLYYPNCCLAEQPNTRSKAGSKSGKAQMKERLRTPLAANCLNLSTTLRVDVSNARALRGEEDNTLVLPAWDPVRGPDAASWHSLISMLLDLPSSCTDLRLHSSRINDTISMEFQERVRLRRLALLNRSRSEPPTAAALPQHPPASALPFPGQFAARTLPGAGDDDSGADGAGQQPGKRMRLDGAGDVAGGVAPHVALPREEDGGAGAPAWQAAHARLEFPAAAAAPPPPPPRQLAGHKRGRQLPGAQALYNGPRPAPAPAPGRGGGEAEQQHHGFRRSQPWTRLHHEVEAFSRRALPSGAELALLSRAMVKIQDAVGQLWPHARTHVFGSQASGLALPCSDLDVVILGVVRDLDTPAQGFSQKEKVNAVDCLRLVAKAIKRLGICKSKPEVISRAKVPIIKATLVDGAVQLPIDISIGVSNGAAAVAMVRQAVLELPPVRPLCLVLKALLREAGLNEVFLGGLSSYSLVIMVIAHLQCEGLDASGVLSACTTRLQTPKPQPPPPAAAPSPSPEQSGPGPAGEGAAAEAEGAGSQTPSRGQALAQEQLEYLQRVSGICMEGYDLGLLLVSFLQRFGAVFSYQEEAVSIFRGGVTDKPNGWQHKGSLLLGLEDPQEPGRDICSGSFNMRKVRKVFQRALMVLEGGGAMHPHPHPHPHLHAHPHSRFPHQQQAPPLAAASAADQEAELWAAVQRDGQSSSVPGSSEPAGPGAAGAGVGAGAGPAGGSGPALLERIIDVGTVLNRSLTPQQRQQAKPRLRQEMAELKASGAIPGARLPEERRKPVSSTWKLRMKAQKQDKDKSPAGKEKRRRLNLKLAVGDNEPWQNGSGSKVQKKREKKQSMKRNAKNARLQDNPEGAPRQQQQQQSKKKTRGGWVMY